MRGDATYREHVNHRSLLAPVALLAAVAMLLAGLCGTAAAAPPMGKDGKIYACYKVKGKPRGAMRLLFKSKKQCKRGERKVAWVAAGSPGSTGSVGQVGAGGSQGGTDPALAAQISALSLRLDSLEGVLAGVTNDDLIGSLATLNGLTNADLTNAVDSVPIIDSLCTQASTLTTGFNALRTGVLSLSILGDITGLLGLDTSGLPAALGAFSCPAVP